MDDVPVIDVAALVADRAARAADPVDPAAVAASAATIDRACRDTGFFLVAGHGIDPGLFTELDGQARAFFARPEAEKAEIAMARGGRAWRGWFPEGGELTAGRPDHKEGLYLGAELAAEDARVRAGRPLHGPNLFPAGVPGLEPAALAWIEAMTALGHALARGVSLGLGLDADWLDRHLTADPTTLFRIFRYPARPAGDDGWGVAEHTDYGLLTILAHDGTPGLQVRGSAGWLDVPAVPGTFVVNLGDMLDRMTGGRYRSTPHRVRHAAGPGGGDRLSFPFFFDPGWEVDVRPVPIGDGTPTDDTPTDDAATRWDGSSVHEWSGTYGDYLTAKVARVFPALGDDVLT